MIRLCALVVWLVLICVSAASAQTIAYDDSNLDYIGRGWKTVAGGRQTPWESGQIRFRVEGTTSLAVNAYVVDPDSSYYSRLLINVDGGHANEIALTTAAESYTGNKTGNLALTAGQHDIIVQGRANIPASQLSEAAIIRFLSFEVDEGATVTPLPQKGWRLALCVGDSWMSLLHSWPMLLDRGGIWPVAYGGSTVASMAANYQYDASGDPAVTRVYVSFGINDYLAGVTLAAFQTSLLSLVDQIQAAQPGITTYLIQPPRNIQAGKYYDQYGAAMENVAGLRSGVVYISTESIWGELEWADGDPYHLSYSGRVAFADWISLLIPPNNLQSIGIYIKRLVGGFWR